MTLFELLSVGVLAVLAALGVMLVVVLIRHTPRSAAGELVGRGDFSAALESAALGPGAERDELLAAAVAAKHLLEFDRAEALARRSIEADPSDGEAWLELGLALGYRGEHEQADEALVEASRHRADLLESISLHRAWVALRAGDTGAALLLFEEISAPLDSKLRSDLGPGDPLFAEWFFQAADLWEETGALDRSAWAREEARRSAPGSLLVAEFA